MTIRYKANETIHPNSPMWHLTNGRRIYDNIKIWIPKNHTKTGYCGATELPTSKHYRLEHFILENKRIRINGVLIPQDCIHIKGTTLSWRYGEEGFYTSGIIYFYAHLFAGYGHIYLGTSPQDCVYMQFTAGLSPVTLDMKVAKQGVLQTTGSHWLPQSHKFGWMPSAYEGEMVSGLQFIYYWDIESEKLIVTLTCNKEDGTKIEYDYSDYYALDFDEEKPGHPLIFLLNCHEEAIYDASSNNRGNIWPYQGKIRLSTDGTKAEALITLVQEPIEDELVEKKEGEKPFLYYCKGEEILDQYACNRKRIHDIKRTPKRILYRLGERASQLTGEDLLRIQIDSADVQSESFYLLTQNMTWCLCQDEKKKEWVNQFIGTTCPPLSQERIDRILNDTLEQTLDTTNYHSAKEWYTNSMSLYWLGSKLGNISEENGGPKHPLTEAENKKLEHWVKGKIQNGSEPKYFYGLPSEYFYSSQTRAVADLAFYNCCSKVCPDLDLYIQEQQLFQQSGGKQGRNWAQWYYDQNSTPAMLSQQVARVTMLKDSSVLNSICSLLNLLEPYHTNTKSNGYTSSTEDAKCIQYYMQIMTLAWGKQWSHIDWHQMTHPELAKWIEDVLSLFCNEVLHRYEVGDPDYQPGGQYYSQVFAAQTLHDLQASLNGWTELADALTTAIIEANNIKLYPKWIDTILNNISQCFDKFPKLQKYGPTVLKGFIKLTISGFCIYSIFLGYQLWDSLTDTEKAETVLATLGTVYTAMDSTLSIYKKYVESKIGNPTIPSESEITTNVAGTSAESSTIETMTRARETITHGENPDVHMATELEHNVVHIENGEVEIQKNSWFSKMVRVNKAELILKGFGVLLNLAMTIVSTIDFSKALRDPNTSDLQKAFYGISIAAGWVSFGLQVAGFAGETGILTMELATMSIVSFAAEIFALVAVLAMIFYMCFAPKPKRAIDQFMDDLRNSDWFKNLLTPPADWNGNTIVVNENDKEKLSGYMYP